MNNVPRQKLCALITTHGPSLCEDSQRCADLLQQSCSQYRRELFLLLIALNERVPADLLASSTEEPPAELLKQLTTRLQGKRAIPEDAARWAVESWALALGIITSAEVSASQRHARIFRVQWSQSLRRITPLVKRVYPVAAGTLLVGGVVVLGIAFGFFSGAVQSINPPSSSQRGTSSSAAPAASTLYQTALAHYTRGNYSLAINDFRSYLALSPETKLATEAHYWLGESYYHLGNYRQTIYALDTLIVKDQESATVPHALLKQALAYLELNELSQAKRVLHSLSRLLPNIPQATPPPDQRAVSPPHDALPPDGSRALQHQIAELIGRNGLDNLTVDVDSQGVVTLSGTVQDANHLATVTRLVTEVPGVQAVYTQAITVRSPEGNLPAIQKELENTLQAEGLHAAQVSIDSDSVVTLTGQVKDEQEKERALFIARSQKGVQGVGSRLREFQFVLTVPRHLENIPVRTDSSLGAQIIGAVDIPKGTKIPVMEAKGNWYKIWITIHAQEQVGWVPRSAVVPSSDMTKPNLQKVVQQARGALQTKGLYDVQVQIDTENMLILTGRVKDDHEEQLALAVTRAQPGIKGVINRLTNRTKVTVKNILGGSFE